MPRNRKRPLRYFGVSVSRPLRHSPPFVKDLKCRSLPPLEALALGAPIALAKASCLPELYGDTARYFDPYDYEVDLDALAARPVAPPDKVLAKYSWDKTAAFWLEEIKKYAQQ